MTGDGGVGVARQAAARRGRAALYAVGGALVAFALLLDLEPSLFAVASPLRVRILALAGALFLSVGRFGSARFLAGIGERLGRPR